MTAAGAPVVLGIETSCDETSAGVVRGTTLLGLAIHSQDEHAVYGGVVPEIAARAHVERLDAVVDLAFARAGLGWSEVDAVAATTGPGLVGALLVGACWARAAAWARGLPFVPVHHMEAHLFGVLLENPDLRPPFVALLVSGGHTLLLHVREWGAYELLGGTRDDAAGEAFDKVAKLLGLPYPGGPALERTAEAGQPGRHRFPRPMLRRDQGPDSVDYYDFSFSGLKTAVVTEVASLTSEELDRERPHLARAFQDAAVDVLVAKTLRAVDATGVGTVVLGGGVSANGRLREAMTDALGAEGRVRVASPRISVDNGAMIARAGVFHLERGTVGSEGGTLVDPRLPFPGLVPAASGGGTPHSPAHHPDV